MRKAFGFAVTLALLALLVLITGGVQAGSPAGSTFLIYDDTNYVNEAQPSIAYNSQDHEYLVVWEAGYADSSDPINPTYYEIWGRRVSGSGAPLGSAFRISPANQGSSPDVAYSSAANEYLVVWAHDVGIWGQRVSASGALQGSVIGIAGGASGFSFCDQPAVAYGSEADRYLVTFRYTLIGTGSTGIWVNSIQSNGNPDGSSVEVHDHSATLMPEEPDVAYNRSRNEFLVVCQQTLGAGNHDIYGRRVEMTNGATPVGNAAFSITNLSYDETVPAVAAVPTVPTVGQYLVTWQTNETFPADIRARTVSGSEALGTVHDLGIPGWGEYRPAVAGCESTYQFLAVWTWVPVPGTNAVMEVQGRTLALDGAPLHATIYVGGVQVFDAAVAAGQACGHLVAFDDNATPGDTTRGIYGRLWGNLVYLPLVMR
jgi:hypothetical protein